MRTARKVVYTAAFYCVATVSIDLTPAILLPDHSASKVKPVLLERRGILQGVKPPESSSKLPVYKYITQTLLLSLASRQL